MSETPDERKQDRVECPASKETAIRWGIIGVLLIGFGVWCFIERHKYDAPASWDLKNINAIFGYLLNHFGAYVFVPPGVALLVWAGIYLRRVLVADDEGIGYKGKEKIPWSDVRELDARKLPKGLLYLAHKDGELKLDSLKLENFKELVAFIEAKVDKDKQIRPDE